MPVMWVEQDGKIIWTREAVDALMIDPIDLRVIAMISNEQPAKLHVCAEGETERILQLDFVRDGQLLYIHRRFEGRHDVSIYAGLGAEQVAFRPYNGKHAGRTFWLEGARRIPFNSFAEGYDVTYTGYARCVGEETQRDIALCKLASGELVIFRLGDVMHAEALPEHEVTV